MSQYVVLVAAVGLLTGLFLLGLGRVGGHDEELRRVARRQADIERKLDLVLDQLGITVPEERFPEVERLLGERKLIPAVKEYRERTGAGLAEAKNAVEEIAHRRGLPLK